ncbi:MAG: BamA/TamA family outer membrane protein [Tenuifilaceae bacterium]
MMKFIRISLLLTILLLIQKVGDSQELTITFSDISKSYKYKLKSSNLVDSTIISKAISDNLLPFYSKGYLAATIDSFYIDSTNVRAFGYRGLNYEWLNIKVDSLSQIWFNIIGISIPKFYGKSINPKQFAKFAEQTIKRFEDSGYPFARVKLQNVKINGNEIDATINLNKGSRITIDTLYIKGDAKIKHSNIMALLNIRKGELYSETKIKSIDQKFRQLPYLSIIKPTEVEFLSSKARLYCYLNYKQASRFSGLVGFYNDQNGKIKLNGDLNLSLVNAMQNGERINFAWNAPGKGTQNLKIETDWPFLFAKQVGVTGSFSLYKHDSTFISINPKISLSFFIQNGARFLLNLDYKKTSFSNIEIVPQTQYANTSALLYGLGFEYNSLNSFLLPTRGTYFKSLLNTGNRKLKQINNNSNLLEGEIQVTEFIPLYENMLILSISSKSRIKTVYKSEGNTKLYENELYRIGGMSSIRGFNQESILSKAYSIATAEIHLRVSEGSGFYLFADKGFVKTYEPNQYKDSWPLGFGIGLNLVTKAGLFNLNYAVGEGFGQTISLRDAKVHFGIATIF